MRLTLALSSSDFQFAPPPAIHWVILLSNTHRDKIKTPNGNDASVTETAEILRTLHEMGFLVTELPCVTDQTYCQTREILNYFINQFGDYLAIVCTSDLPTSHALFLGVPVLRADQPDLGNELERLKFEAAFAH